MGPGCVKTQIKRRLGDTDLSDRALRRFLEVGNGKGTPENTPIARFYTAWVGSSRSRPRWWRCGNCQIRDAVGRSYFDIRTGPSQLFSEKSSQLLAKSAGTARCRSSFRRNYFGKSQLAKYQSLFI
jgi:hypothetical protein